MCIAKISPLYTFLNINSITNYRPISFERVIFNQLYTYLDHKNLLSDQQYGFCANHLAELAAIKLGRLHRACKRQEINTCQYIYIDLSKAFDILNFDILLYKLHYYGITDIALSNRKQYVNVNQYGVK